MALKMNNDIPYILDGQFVQLSVFSQPVFGTVECAYYT